MRLRYKLSSIFPFLEWIKSYNSGTFLDDLTAGLTIFIFLVPQSMAFALLAGFAPVYGLYSSIFPLYVYAILGTSRQLSMGPMALTALLLGQVCQRLGYQKETSEYMLVALNVGIQVALISFLIGIFNLGMVANLISRTVLVGFVTASGLVIGISQFKWILGIYVPSFQYNSEVIGYMLTHLGESNGYSVLLGLLSILILVLVRSIKQRLQSNSNLHVKKDAQEHKSSVTEFEEIYNEDNDIELETCISIQEPETPSLQNQMMTLQQEKEQRDGSRIEGLGDSRIPGMSFLQHRVGFKLCSTSQTHRIVLFILNLTNLALIGLGSLVAYKLYQEYHISIDIVGHVPRGLNLSPTLKLLPMSQFTGLIGDSVAISFVAFASNWAVAKKYARINHYDVNASQEFIAQAISLASSLLTNGFIVSGGLGRSVVNAENGAKTQIAGCITATLILISLLFLTSIFYYIPMCVLAAIIEVSVLSMIDFQEMIAAYYKEKKDCFVMWATFLITFFLGVSNGLYAGVGLSLLLHILYPMVFPEIHVLKVTKNAIGSLQYQKTNHNKSSVTSIIAGNTPFPNVIVLKMATPLNYANCYLLKEKLERLNSTLQETWSMQEPLDFKPNDSSTYINEERCSRYRYHLFLDGSSWPNHLDLVSLECLIHIILLYHNHNSWIEFSITSLSFKLIQQLKDHTSLREHLSDPRGLDKYHLDLHAILSQSLHSDHSNTKGMTTEIFEELKESDFDRSIPLIDESRAEIESLHYSNNHGC